ncbi:MAG: flagellar hook-length control protein FliK [Candidatus Marinimicrobia bacterium]|nr:flagellar hook-length control protein FliK [Candidatus Neomarinimicrobiota bacterium]MCF7880503.1 flagellar hook-length control protein FliK [Candidatus Neomarinimicrobiota bacterium]
MRFSTQNITNELTDKSGYTPEPVGKSGDLFAALLGKLTGTKVLNNDTGNHLLDSKLNELSKVINKLSVGEESQQKLGKNLIANQIIDITGISGKELGAVLGINGTSKMLDGLVEQLINLLESGKFGQDLLRSVGKEAEGIVIPVKLPEKTTTADAVEQQNRPEQKYGLLYIRKAVSPDQKKPKTTSHDFHVFLVRPEIALRNRYKSDKPSSAPSQMIQRETPARSSTNHSLQLIPGEKGLLQLGLTEHSKKTLTPESKETKIILVGVLRTNSDSSTDLGDPRASRREISENKSVKFTLLRITPENSEMTTMPTEDNAEPSDASKKAKKFEIESPANPKIGKAKPDGFATIVKSGDRNTDGKQPNSLRSKKYQAALNGADNSWKPLDGYQGIQSPDSRKLDNTSSLSTANIQPNASTKSEDVKIQQTAIKSGDTSGLSKELLKVDKNQYSPAIPLKNTEKATTTKSTLTFKTKTTESLNVDTSRIPKTELSTPMTKDEIPIQSAKVVTSSKGAVSQINDYELRSLSNLLEKMNGIITTKEKFDRPDMERQVLLGSSKRSVKAAIQRKPNESTVSDLTSVHIPKSGGSADGDHRILHRAVQSSGTDPIRTGHVAHPVQAQDTVDQKNTTKNVTQQFQVITTKANAAMVQAETPLKMKPSVKTENPKGEKKHGFRAVTEKPQSGPAEKRQYRFPLADKSYQPISAAEIARSDSSEKETSLSAIKDALGLVDGESSSQSGLFSQALSDAGQNAGMAKMAPEQSIMTQVIERIQSITQQVKSFNASQQVQNINAQIQLKPATLGSVLLSLKFSENTLQGTIYTSSNETKQTIEKQMPVIREAIQHHNVALNDIKVEVRPDMQQEQRQSFADQFMREHSQSGTERDARQAAGSSLNRGTGIETQVDQEPTQPFHPTGTGGSIEFYA